MLLGVWVSLYKCLSTVDYFLLHSCDEKSSEAKWSVNASVTSVLSVNDVLKICWVHSLSDDEMIKEKVQARVCMLVNTASEGESDESVVSAKSEKSEKWGEKWWVGGRVLLDWHRNSTPIKSPSLRKTKKIRPFL